MRRTATTFVMLALSAMIVVPVAAADKPVREPAPAPSEFTIDASICGFDVLVEVLTNKQYAITFSNGMTTVVGALSVRLTNVDDPTHSIVINIPGPGFFAESGVLTATGPWPRLPCGARLHRRPSTDRRHGAPPARRAAARPLPGALGSIRNEEMGRGGHRRVLSASDRNDQWSVPGSNR
jgi:hypothetical protein